VACRLTAIEHGDWSLLPEALALLLGEIGGGRDTVVECGSGVSTMAIARALAERGTGSLHALEHDREWADRVRRRLAEEGTAGAAEVIEAPLRPHPLAEPDCGWYDAAALERLPGEIGLLLVDGPPGSLSASGRTRYPALPLLAGHLAPGALVILDDIERAGELDVLERWQREFAIEFELRPEQRIAIGVFSEPGDPAEGPGDEERKR
jgi:predicted O-methyltransferase YrrM